MRLRVGLALLMGVILPVLPAAPAQAVQAEVIAERMHVIYDPVARSVRRALVRVVDPHPEKNLDFVWEPAADNLPGIDQQTRLASGDGKLVWRVRGSASFDPRSVYSTYRGMLARGLPDGRGRLELRSGAIYEGTWKAGLLEGAGLHRDAEGNIYEGAFRAGVPHGQGTYRGRDGSIYEGPFADGRRHGMATTRLPGGTAYRSQWVMGRETGGMRPNAVADALIGGLLTAQDGGDAGKVGISVVVDQRMTAQYTVQYQHLVRDEDIAVYPVKQLYNDAWNGTGAIPDDFVAYWEDWQKDFAFLEVEVATEDGSKVELDALAVDVASSEAYLKPMLTRQEHLGCVGFRPGFTLKNYGWGEVRNPRISVRFASLERPGAESRPFEVPVADFDEGAVLSLQSVLDEAGVDTSTLRAERFQCASAEQLPQCQEEFFSRVGFGEIADFVDVDGGTDIVTTAKGDISYQWADGAGNLYGVTEPFSARISLAVIEVALPLAEGGDFSGDPPAARRYVDIVLPVGEGDYSIGIPFRGNRNVSKHTARLKMSSHMSSLHRFRVSARFVDGSARFSKPLTLFYLKPRIPSVPSETDDMACYLYQ